MRMTGYVRHGVSVTRISRNFPDRVVATPENAHAEDAAGAAPPKESGPW